MEQPPIKFAMIGEDDLKWIKRQMIEINQKFKPSPIDHFMEVTDLIKRFPSLNKERVLNWFEKGQIKGKRIGRALFVDIRSLGIVDNE